MWWLDKYETQWAEYENNLFLFRLISYDWEYGGTYWGERMYDWRKFVNLDSSVSSVEKNSVQGNEGNLYSKIFLQVVTIYLRVQNSAIGMKNSLKSQIVDETKRQTSD